MSEIEKPVFKGFCCPYCDHEFTSDQCQEAGEYEDMIHESAADKYCSHDHDDFECPKEDELEKIPSQIYDRSFFKELKEAFLKRDGEEFNRLIGEINLSNHIVLVGEN